jgi:hypothetical protein
MDKSGYVWISLEDILLYEIRHTGKGKYENLIGEIKKSKI